MTVESLEKQRQQRIAAVAQEYRQKGYVVTVAPQPGQLPDFLTSFPIDLLACNPNENVIIVVRTRASLSTPPALTTIAEAIEGRTDWRFELIVTNPKDYHFIGVDLNVLDPRAVDYRLREAKQLAEQEYGEAAILLAWSALEAILRRTAQSEQIELEQENPNYLLKHLFAYGLLSREQLQILQASLQARNVIVHGYQTQEQQIAGLLDQLLNIATQLSTLKMAA